MATDRASGSPPPPVLSPVLSPVLYGLCSLIYILVVIGIIVIIVIIVIVVIAVIIFIILIIVIIAIIVHIFITLIIVATHTGASQTLLLLLFKTRDFAELSYHRICILSLWVRSIGPTQTFLTNELGP